MRSACVRGVGYLVTLSIHRIIVYSLLHSSLEHALVVELSITHTGSSQGPGIYRRVFAHPKDQVYQHAHSHTISSYFVPSSYQVIHFQCLPQTPFLQLIYSFGSLTVYVRNKIVHKLLITLAG